MTTPFTLDLLITNSTKRPLNHVPLIELVKGFLRYTKHTGNYYLELHFVGNKHIRTLNQQFRHQNTATDVLSFPMSQPSEIKNSKLKIINLGSIVISLPFAAAKKERIVDLVIHGLMHIIEQNHDTESQNNQWDTTVQEFWLRYQGSAPSSKN